MLQTVKNCRRALRGGLGPPSRGFTLIELAVVVVIIGILAAIILPNFVRLKDKAREAESKAGLHGIQTTLERFGVDHDGTYPEYMIGGNNTASVLRFGKDDRVNYLYLETPFEHCSDPLLRYGYLTSYPRNPFVANAQPVQLMQKRYGDPLRSTFPDGRKFGTRFGANCDVMGQVLCDARWLEFRCDLYNTGEIKSYDSWANIQFEFYDVWAGKLMRPYLPGSFMYKSIGELMPTAGKRQSQDIVDLGDGQQAAVPQDVRKEATFPIALTQYMLGVWGSIRTKGMDVLGEEPLVLFSFVNTKRGINIPTFIYDPDSGRYVLPSVQTRDTFNLLGIAPWTRGVNRSHIGPLWGSPYGPSQSEDRQLEIGNPNGLRDGIIMILSSGDN